MLMTCVTCTLSVHVSTRPFYDVSTRSDPQSHFYNYISTYSNISLSYAVLLRNFFFFFFSSRRRHTRLQGDWSSDVCSSDLYFIDIEKNKIHRLEFLC